MSRVVREEVAELLNEDPNIDERKGWRLVSPGLVPTAWGNEHIEEEVLWTDEGGQVTNDAHRILSRRDREPVGAGRWLPSKHMRPLDRLIGLGGWSRQLPQHVLSAQRDAAQPRAAGPECTAPATPRARRTSAAAAGWAARTGRGTLPRMTSTLDAAIAKLTALPPEEQDRVARWILEELRDEEAWATRFGASQETLGRLAREARADRAAGRVAELEPDEL